MSLLALYIHRQVCISSIIISFPRPQRRKVSVSAHAIQICTYRLVQTRAYRLVGTRLDVHTRVYRFVGTDLNVQTRVYKFRTPKPNFRYLQILIDLTIKPMFKNASFC